MIVEPCFVIAKSGAEPSVPGQANQVRRFDDMVREAFASE